MDNEKLISRPEKVLEEENNESVLEKSWKFFKNMYETRIKYFLPQIIVLENLHFDLEKFWKSH